MTYDTKTRKENQAIFVRTECSGGGTPYNRLYVLAPPEWGTLSGFR